MRRVFAKHNAFKVLAYTAVLEDKERLFFLSHCLRRRKEDPPMDDLIAVGNVLMGYAVALSVAIVIFIIAGFYGGKR